MMKSVVGMQSFRFWCFLVYFEKKYLKCGSVITKIKLIIFSKLPRCFVAIAWASGRASSVKILLQQLPKLSLEMN